MSPYTPQLAPHVRSALYKPEAQHVQLRKLSWWHESIIDWMLLHPEGRLADCAAEFDCSASWLSIITHSDLFRVRLAQRRAELAGEIGATVVDRLGGIANQALEGIAEKIEKEKAKLPIGELRETASMALQALGYGVKGSAAREPAGNVYNFNGPTHVSRDVLESARQRMRLVGARAADESVNEPARILDASATTHHAPAPASVPRVPHVTDIDDFDDSNSSHPTGALSTRRPGDVG